MADTGAFGPLSNASSPTDDIAKATFIDHFIYAGLYRRDALQRPMPDLATSCTPDAAGTMITCTLGAATFHNGQPVTADDVAFTYRLANANTGVDSEFGRPCIEMLLPIASACLFEILEAVEKVDARTVAFHLKRPYAPFYTLVLPVVWIDSRAVVMAAYDAFRAKAASMDPAMLRTAAADLTKTVNTASADCEPHLAAAADLVQRSGLRIPDRADFNLLQGGAFDACSYAIQLVLDLSAAAASLSGSGDAAIAAAYPALQFNRAPVGAGPYRFISYEPGRRLVLEADPSYHGGPVATPRYAFDFYPDVDAAAAAVQTGAADWTEVYFHSAPALAATPGLQIGQPRLPAYTEVLYNVRPGRLFSDVNLRRAVNLCMDKAAVVRAAADVSGVPAMSDIGPGWWGYNADLGEETRDVAAGRRLIEAAGWKIGPDGIYVKDGKRLAATVYVRTNAADRVRFVDLMSILVRDCGMDLRANQEDFGGGLASLSVWPNTAPGSKEPFDLYFVGQISGLDPLPFPYLTAEITRKELPDGQNIGGFSNARIDEIAQALLSIYDLEKRTALYREYQTIIVDQQPALFAWHLVRLVALSPGMTSIDGPLDPGLMNWSWAPERLVLFAP